MVVIVASIVVFLAVKARSMLHDIMLTRERCKRFAVIPQIWRKNERTLTPPKLPCPYPAAAPLTDAALTSYHVVKRSLHLLGAGATAVVIGVGGLGQMAVQLLRMLSGATTIVALDTTAEKLEIARKMGADEALHSGEQAVNRVKAMTSGQGANLVLDMVGVDATLKMAAQAASALGHLTIVGLGGGALPVNIFTLPHECSVASPYWGSITELVEVVSLAQAGKIRMLVEHFPLARAGEAYRLLNDGKIQGRAVITPND